MKTNYPVDTGRFFKSLSKFLSVALVVAVIFGTGVRYVSKGFDYERTFEGISLTETLLILICAPPFAIACSYLISLTLQKAGITLENGTLSGCNYWIRRKQIPIDDLKKIIFISNNGIKAYLVQSNSHGAIYISEHTKNLPDLLTILNAHLPEDARIDISSLS